MKVISNTSPLISLSRIKRLDILQKLFGKISITPEVLAEVLPSQQNEEYQHIIEALQDFIQVENATKTYPFKRAIQAGEKSVLNLAWETEAEVLIIDDRKARNEAKEMGLKAFLAYTSDILKQAEAENIIDSYQTIREELQKVNIFMPDFE